LEKIEGKTRIDDTLYLRKQIVKLMVIEFKKLVKKIIAPLPKDDYPVLNTQLFVKIWLEFVMDKSVTSMRSLFSRMNYGGYGVDISTFSKASKNRELEVFVKTYQRLNQMVAAGMRSSVAELVPIDATVISLTSKLLWKLGYHQVKLFVGTNTKSGSMSGSLINFGQGHDYNYGDKVISSLDSNQVGVLDRGFAGASFINSCCQQKKKFVVRIKNNYKLELDEQRGCVIWANKDLDEYCRVVAFSDLKTKKEYRLATNLDHEGDAEVTNEEIGEFYRQRCAIELLWKFLKMHLKLDQLITKNLNGITIQIYMSLIAYLLLQLVSVPGFYGKKLLDKLNYLQAFKIENRE
jgi:putative transposase